MSIATAVMHSRPAASMVPDRAKERWQVVLCELEENIHTRVQLEARESTLLLEAEECELPRRLGYVSMAEFMERRLHYTRHAANERMRVARELKALPKLRRAFEAGEMSFTHVRELTRVATPKTEAAFLKAADGQTAKQVQQMVSGKKAGDLPDAPPDPALVRHRIFLEVDGEAFASWRRVHVALEAEVGERLDDTALVGILCRRALEVEVRDRAHADSPAEVERGTDAPSLGDQISPPSPMDGRARPPRASRIGPLATMHSVTTCRTCHRAEVSAVGHGEVLTAAQRARAQCDTLSGDDLETDDLTRLTSVIPTALRRKVFTRDHHACVAPGCRSRRNLDVHHVVPRAAGGQHTVSNLVVLCSFHHQRLHEGLLAVTGQPPHDLEVRWRHEAPPSLDPVLPAHRIGPRREGPGRHLRIATRRSRPR